MRPTVLLVDDDENFLVIARRALERADIDAEICIAQDGGEALSLLGLDESAGVAPLPAVAVVLLDLNMPVTDGWEVMRRIREHEETRDLPVVVVSSSRNPDDIQRSYDRGANSYVSKRFDPTSPGAYLAETVRYWTELNEPPGFEGRSMG
ncbi:MAG: response regulator [Candidatus Rokuibacteriota bacterium]